MQIRNRRQRQALYSGIAEASPPITRQQAVDRFKSGYALRPHTATMFLLHDMQGIMTRSPRRALPGVATTD